MAFIAAICSAYGWIHAGIGCCGDPGTFEVEWTDYDAEGFPYLRGNATIDLYPGEWKENA